MATVAACILLVTGCTGPGGSAVAPALVSPLDPSTPAGSTAREAGIAGDLQRLCAVMATAPAQFPSRGMPLPVRLAFLQPFALPEIARSVTDATLGADTRPFRAVAAFAARTYGVECPVREERSTVLANDPQRAIYALDFLLNGASSRLREALAQAELPDDGAAAIDRTLGIATRSTGPRNAQVPTEVAAALQSAARLDRAALVAAAGHFDEDLDVAADWSSFPAEALPEELAGAVDGTVLGVHRVDELGWLVVGGPGANRYDMGRIAAVFDPAGDDRYEWAASTVGSRLVIDLAGDDVHATVAGTGPAVSGPAGAALGVSVIDDRAGNDRYQGARNAIGAAAFGVGILVDRAGNDVYDGDAWTVGAAVAGIGAVCDLGGDDLYVSQLFSQACGGPGGAALLLDLAGGDRYRADGRTPSAYGQPTVGASFSQGAGFGYRIGGAGGIGALVDRAGNDRYECGEFGQGCGYFLSMGIVHDGGGDDFYYGHRYAQGSAAHQAFGAMLDDAGHDTYWAMTAANQGAAWDMAAAVLVDREGDDTYRADGLSQGAAAQQAIGMLVDLSGSDAYRAAGASQGAADGNEYHWDSTRSASAGILLDRAGPNRFAGNGADGERRVRGDRTQPSGRTAWGLLITR
jgi:hypothetical protein